MAHDASWLLCLDASTPRCVVALGRSDGRGHAELVASDVDEGGPDQPSAHLLDRLRAMTKAAKIEPSDIGVVACGRGPGTFTGTRVAVATAKGVALGLGLPLIGMSTLAALAMSAGHTGLVLPLLDARRGEVYGALVEVDPTAFTITTHTPEGCSTLTALALTVPDATAAIVAIGPGVSAYAKELPAAWADRVMPVQGPSAEGLFAAAVSRHVAGAARPAAELAAVYLRKSYAELGVNPPKRPFAKSPFV